MIFFNNQSKPNIKSGKRQGLTPFFILIQNVKVFFLIFFIALIVGCKSEVKVIKVADKEYSRKEMKDFLYELWWVKEYSGKKPFFNWPRESFEIIYELNVAGNLDKKHLQTILDQQVDYFASITGLTFRKPKDEFEFVNISIFMGSSIDELKQHPNLVLFKNAEDLKFREFYNSLKEPIREENTIIHRVTASSPVPIGSERHFSVFDASVSTVIPSSVSSNIDAGKFFSRIIFSALIGGIGVVRKGSMNKLGTIMTSFYDKEAYLWPLDMLLIEIIYKGTTELSNVSREEVVEFVLDQMESN